MPQGNSSIVFLLFSLSDIWSFPVSGSRVVFVKNLNEQQVTPEILFRLFSVYGDVEKLKVGLFVLFVFFCCFFYPFFFPDSLGKAQQCHGAVY